MPQLWVSDIAASSRFFTEKLGFSQVFTYGEPPFYGQVQRDSAVIALRHVDTRPIAADLVEQQTLLSAEITVDRAEDITALYAEFRAAGVAFHQVLQRQPWGAMNFIIKDLDDNLLLFAGPAE